MLHSPDSTAAPMAASNFFLWRALPLALLAGAVAAAVSLPTGAVVLVIAACIGALAASHIADAAALAVTRQFEHARQQDFAELATDWLWETDAGLRVGEPE